MLDLSVETLYFPRNSQLAGLLANELPRAHQKAPINGNETLRKAIARLYSDRFFKVYNPDSEVTVTSASHSALFLAIASMAKDGDEVIVFEPASESLSVAIRTCGARPVYVSLKEHGSIIDWTEVQRAIGPETALIVFANPNPILGRVLSSDDLENLQKLINGTNIRIVCDESLVEFALCDTVPTSIALFPKLAAGSYIVGSLDTIVGAVDWELGFCLAPEQLLSGFMHVQKAFAGTPSNAIQQAVGQYISEPHENLPIIQTVEQNRNTLVSLLSPYGFSLPAIQAGFIQPVNYRNLSQRKDTEVVEWLKQSQEMTISALSEFYHDRSERFCLLLNLTADADSIEKAAQKLLKLTAF